MLTLGIRPTDHCYTMLMLGYAKTKNLDKVLQLNKDAISKHGIEPSVNRMNSVLLAYCKAGEMW